MTTQTYRNARRRRIARRTQSHQRPRDPLGTPHDRAIQRLSMELKAREGLMGLFHAGVTWRALVCLVDMRKPIVVQTEKSIKINGSRFIPDLVVLCERTRRILLVIEVWHTHAVSGRKKAAFQAAGFSWIEVKSWHVISRYRQRPLPVLDWGGDELPEGPKQFGLFDEPLIGSRQQLSSLIIQRRVQPIATLLRAVRNKHSREHPMRVV